MKKIIALTVASIILFVAMLQPICAVEEGIIGEMGKIYVVLREGIRYTKDDFPGINITRIYYNSPTTVNFWIKEKTIEDTDKDMEIINDIISSNVSYIVQYYNIVTVGDLMWINGDADKNGKCDLADVSLVLKYIAGWDVDIYMDAVDIYRDGKATLKDVSAMLKKIAGWKQSDWFGGAKI